jgi:hypothetical protein
MWDLTEDAMPDLTKKQLLVQNSCLYSYTKLERYKLQEVTSMTSADVSFVRMKQ